MWHTAACCTIVARVFVCPRAMGGGLWHHLQGEFVAPGQPDTRVHRCRAAASGRSFHLLLVVSPQLQASDFRKEGEGRSTLLRLPDLLRSTLCHLQLTGSSRQLLNEPDRQGSLRLACSVLQRLLLSTSELGISTEQALCTQSGARAGARRLKGHASQFRDWASRLRKLAKGS